MGQFALWTLVPMAISQQPQIWKSVLRERLDKARSKSKELLGDFSELAREAYQEGGEIAFEWPMTRRLDHLTDPKKRDLKHVCCGF